MLDDDDDDNDDDVLALVLAASLRLRMAFRFPWRAVETCSRLLVFRLRSGALSLCEASMYFRN